MVGAFMGEIMSRNPHMKADARRIIQKKLYTKMPGIFKALDKNHDQQLSPEEYEAKKKGGDFGHEILEAAESSKDMTKKGSIHGVALAPKTWRSEESRVRMG